MPKLHAVDLLGEPRPLPQEFVLRLRLLLGTAYLVSRIKGLRSPLDLLRRSANVFVYLYYRFEHGYYELTGRYWRELYEWTAEKNQEASTAVQQSWRRLKAIRRDAVVAKLEL